MRPPGTERSAARGRFPAHHARTAAAECVRRRAVVQDAVRHPVHGAGMNLRQLEDVLWEIDAGERAGMRVPARIYADAAILEAVREDGSLEQLANVATLPGIVG